MTNHKTNRMNRLAASPAKAGLAAVIAAAALLGLSACASGKNTPTAQTSASGAPAVAAPSASDSPTAPAAPSSSQNAPADPSQSQSAPAAYSATTDPAASPSSHKSTAKPANPTKPSAPKSTAPPADAQPVGCAPTQLKATVTTLTRPINHVLLTVTNTGKAACDLYYYPALRFDADQQSVTAPVEDSKPQAVVTIAPGESGYAAIGTSAADGSGANGKVEKQVEVFLENRDQSGSLPGELKLALPANTYVDDKAFVTYWQSDLQSAVTW